MSSPPWLTIAVAAAGLYVFRLWQLDYHAFRAGRIRSGALPGATPVKVSWIALGTAGAFVLLALETGGEIAMGVVDQQSTITALALLGFVAAGFYEELIFRGFIFYDRRGTGWLIASCAGASLVFALLHYQYYIEMSDQGKWHFRFDLKASWTLLLLFLNSLWFYFLRFSSRNPHRSLLPCFVAHISSNLGVFFIKAAQGFVSGCW